MQRRKMKKIKETEKITDGPAHFSTKGYATLRMFHVMRSIGFAMYRPANSIYRSLTTQPGCLARSVHYWAGPFSSRREKFSGESYISRISDAKVHYWTGHLVPDARRSPFFLREVHFSSFLFCCFSFFRFYFCHFIHDLKNIHF